mmetsp:Transcript_19373/g.57484  ORF Transcript_19373/g.57484 Transcript_19373/m.57484 type:complete len:291 (+) Transcript_19373:241-1113(+)
MLDSACIISFETGLPFVRISWYTALLGSCSTCNSSSFQWQLQKSFTHAAFLTARIIPYCMSPDEKPSCMRRSPSTSRNVRYQACGRASRYHGSLAALMMLLCQSGRVCNVQSSLQMPSSMLVPFIRRSNSWIEMKNGWAHSSYKNCSCCRSSSVNFRCSVSSRWHQHAMTNVPPGFSTLAISSMYFFLSGMCSPLSHAHTKSNVLSANSIFSASITCSFTLSSPLSAHSSMPRCTCFGDSVMPVTLASGKSLPRWRLVPPNPQPTSRTRTGLLAPLNFNISSQKSYLACL